MTKKTILALDLGTKTGWAFRDEKGRIKSGREHFKKFSHEGLRYLNFRRWLTESKNAFGQIDHVYFEQVRQHAGTDAAHVYGGLRAILAAWCAHHRIPCSGIGVGTIKKHATGSGRADKEQMIAAMKIKGFKPETDDEADALAILFCAEDRNA